MGRYIAFLRGINVSGQKKILMKDLRESLNNAGFTNVQTYIQSGNVVFEATSSKIGMLATQIEEAIKKDFGFDVPVLVKTQNELVEIMDRNPFAVTADDKNQYFALLNKCAEPEMVQNLNASDYPNEEFYITDACVYLNCKIGAGKAKLTNNLIEKKLKVTATTRNLKTMKKMIELEM